MVFVNYCDGGSFSGTRTEPVTYNGTRPPPQKAALAAAAVASGEAACAPGPLGRGSWAAAGPGGVGAWLPGGL